MSKRTPQFFILSSGFVAASMLCFGQAGRAELFGTIQDPSTRSISKAKVEAEDQATMVRYAVVSDDRGEYHILGLPAGRYVLTVEKAGFRTYRQSGITLRLGDRKIGRASCRERVEINEIDDALQITHEVL